MIVTELHDVTLEDLVLDDGTRSPGLHQSTILKDILQTLEPKRFDPKKPFDLLRVQLGMAFEDAIGGWLTRRIKGWTKPGEFKRDGIIVSPDGFDEEAWEGTEIKATYVSSKEGILHPKLSHWHMQMKGYCKVLGTRIWNVRPLFICGDYKPPFPQLRGFRCEYSQREIDDYWAMALGHARKRGMLK